jgi:quercetin dioxygenase-like cupin family protein
MQADLLSLLAALAAICDTEDRAEARATARALRGGADAAAFAPRPPTEVDAAVGALAADPAALPAAGKVASAAGWIDWGVNPVAGQMTARAAAMTGIATFLGPEGPIRSPEFRLGLLWMRPDSYYPLHNHDADETYVILAGRAFWTAGPDRRWRGAGEVIHHPGLMPHAFRTAAEGMLALWRWSGDINTHSYTFLPDPEAG